jgi:hypothetical protein
VCKINAWHVIDAPIIGKVYQEDVDDSAAVSISLVVDLSPLMHEQGINNLLDFWEEALDWNQDSNDINSDGGSEWETDSETKVKFDEYNSEHDSNE